MQMRQPPEKVFNYDREMSITNFQEQIGAMY